MDSTLVMAGIRQRDDELIKEMPPGQYADALFNFVHALLKIDEMGDYPALADPLVFEPERLFGTVPGRAAAGTRSTARPRIKGEVHKLVAECVPQDRFVLNWYDPTWDRYREYPVDFMVNGMPGRCSCTR